MKKVAQELVAVAKLILGIDIKPITDNQEKIEKVVANLQGFMTTGMVPNARYKDAYSSLTWQWEFAYKKLQEEIFAPHRNKINVDREAWDKIYWGVIELFDSSITRFPLAVKKLSKYEGPDKDKIAKFLDSWKPVYELLISAKAMSVKRTQLPTKKDEEQKQREQWLKPMQSNATLTMVRGILEKIIQQHYNELVKSLVDYYTSKVEVYQKTVDDFAKSDVLSFYDYRKENLYPEDNMLIQKFTSWVKATYGGHEKQEIIFDSTKAFTTLTAMGKEQAEFMREQYIVKNMSKIAAVINEKEKASHSTITKHDASGRFSHSIFEGKLDFEFSDGSGFTVINQAVFVVNQQHTMFYRYPTTFHNVKFSNGTVKAMVPEQSMVQEWSKA
jgi:hypothetical protein